MKIIVSEKDIRNGLRNSYTHNPICRAVQRAIKTEFGAEVKVEVIQLDFMFINGCIVELPKQAQVLLSKFHRGERIQPIVFEVSDLPDGFFSREYSK